MRCTVAAGALVVTTLIGPEFAEPNCTSEPKAKWLSESEMKAKIASLGYKFQIFKVTSGNCYEIYGRDAAGKRIEIYFHPISGEVVKQHKS